MTYTGESQVNGLNAHVSIDAKKYSSKTTILQSLEVYSSKYNLIGKIDLFDVDKGLLMERKYKVERIYDGYIFQLYAQYFALCEMGHDVKALKIHSISNNKSFNIDLPSENLEMFCKFERLLEDIRNFSIDGFVQENSKKCLNCIYEPACDRSLLC